MTFMQSSPYFLQNESHNYTTLKKSSTSFFASPTAYIPPSSPVETDANMCNHHYYAYACGHDGPLIYSYCGHHEDQQSFGRLPIDGPFGIIGTAHYCRQGYIGKTMAPDHSNAQAQRRRTPDCCSSRCRERVEAEQGRWEEAKAQWIEDRQRYEEASWEWANDAGHLESAKRQWEAD